MQIPLRSDDSDRKHPRFGPKSRGTALKLWNTHLRCELHEFILAPSLRCLIHHPVVTSRLSFGRNPIQEIIRFWIALSSCFRGRVVVFHSIVRYLFSFDWTSVFRIFNTLFIGDFGRWLGYGGYSMCFLLRPECWHTMSTLTSGSDATATVRITGSLDLIP